MENYIKVYEWLLQQDELTRLEALLISEIMRWPKGCYKSSNQLAKLLKSDTRTIQRMIKSLQRRQWLAVFGFTKQSRTIWATPKDPPAGPLFEYRQKAAKAMIAKTARQLTLWDKQWSQQ